jgi:hypothetical protein
MSPCSGAAQATAICFLLFQASTLVDGYFERQTLPDQASQYTAHNVAVLVQTVCRGLVYLITFIFGANAVGLTGALRCAGVPQQTSWPV